MVKRSVLLSGKGLRNAEEAVSPEEIIRKLREAEVLINQGQTIVTVCRTLGVTDQTYYRWRKEYGRMKLDQAKRLKELEVEGSVIVWRSMLRTHR